MQLKVDTVWCSKCKICRTVSGGRIRFREDGYPAEGKVADGYLEQVRAAVAYCPIGALGLSGD